MSRWIAGSARRGGGRGAPLTTEKGLELEVLSGLEPIELICDRRVVIRILLYLAENAIDFTDEGLVLIELDQPLSQG